MKYQELPSDDIAILRAVESGERFVLTHDGAPIAEVIPIRRKRFVSREEVIRAARTMGRIDWERFRADNDALVDAYEDPERHYRKVNPDAAEG